MRLLVVIALVVWVVAVIGWARAYGVRSYLKLAGVLALGMVAGVAGFLVLGLVWWALGGFLAMVAVIALIFGVIYWIDRRKVKAFDATG
jgi:hypothetical protein